MSKKILLILPHDGFRDKEYSWLVERFKEGGIIFDVASSHLSVAKGLYGELVKPDVLLRSVSPSEYEAYILIGEEAASEYFGNNDVISILEYASEHSKLVGAIGLAVSVLTRSRIVSGRRLTGPTDLQRTIEDAGAFYHGRLIEIDNNLITASGPYGTREFAEAIVEYLGDGKSKSGREYLR
jgi:putative intracellular protease/amidase